LSVEAFRLQNFMPFEDTGWVELRPICLLFGRNSSGKSAIIRALRFLRQSLGNQSSDTPFTYYAEHGVDVGDYRTVVHRQDVTRNMAFSFRCTIEHTLEDVRSKVNVQRAEKELDPISAKDFTPWVEIKLTYSWEDADTQAQLCEFKIVGLWNVGTGDEEPCTLLGALELPSTATFSEDEWWFWSDVLLGYEGESETAWYGVSVESVHGFLPSLVIPPLELKSSSPSFGDLKLADALLKELDDEIHRFLDTIEYLGPIRPQPQRVYAFDPLIRLRWKKRGWGAFLRLLQNDIDEEEINQIDGWMQKLDLGDHILPDKENYVGTLAVVAQVKVEESENTRINLVDTGYGASQVLPIIVECVLAERDVLVIIEQPELHLHPRAQARLADLLIEVATRGRRLIDQRKLGDQSLPTRDELRSLRVRFLVETHSEHLLLRLRRRIAETSAGELSASEDRNKQLKNDQVAVLFLDKIFGQSVVQSVSVTNLGDFAYTPAGFRDFFADDVDEILALSRASREAKEYYED
jgi:predicted ATPase